MTEYTGDEPETTREEFLARQGAGRPAHIVTSREQYERELETLNILAAANGPLSAQQVAQELIAGGAVFHLDGNTVAEAVLRVTRPQIHA